MSRLVLTLVRDQLNEPQKKVKIYNGDKFITYRTDIDIRSLKNYTQLLDWDEVNPREPDEKAKPCKGMKKTLANEDDDIFSVLNGGVLLSAEECRFYKDKRTNTHMVDIILSDSNIHGYIDGGHSLDIVMHADKIKSQVQHIEF